MNQVILNLPNEQVSKLAIETLLLLLAMGPGEVCVFGISGHTVRIERHA
jgi:hypothetical protein